MPIGPRNSRGTELVGTLRFVELEGGFWALQPDEPHERLGAQVVLSGWAPHPPLGDGSRVRARVRESDARFGVAMAGEHVDVLGVDALDAP